MKPSKYQQRIFDFITKEKGNAIIQAVAGSGKTTTIVEATKLIAITSKSIFVAFNKAIADELNTKLPSHIKAKTLHSFGLSLFPYNTNSYPKVDNDKMDEIVTTCLKEDYSNNQRLFDEYFGLLKKICNLIKTYGIDFTKYSNVDDLITENDIDTDLNNTLFDLINGVMNMSNKRIDLIDFNDMIYLPIYLNFKSYTFDWVFVDESQDLNKVQFELIKKMCNGHTRVVAVGDRQQSIYAFRGVDTESMDNFKDYFKAIELPLSISYRCPKSVVNLAKEIVPHIEYKEDAKDGVVREVKIDEVLQNSRDKDLILCRTNAPLIYVAFGLIRLGKKATIKGRDIGKNLIRIVNRYKVTNINDLISKIEHYKRLQEEKVTLIQQGKYDKRKKNGLMADIDSCDAVLIMSDACESIGELKSKIDSIFTDFTEGIVCSTIHKAKGLEAERVFIINYELMPHPMAKTPEEIQQEMNIKYVAITRSKSELYLLNKL